MIQVAVLGPESTGGRLVARLLATDPLLEVRHWSMPHGPPGGDRHYPTTRSLDGYFPDYLVITVRDWDCSLQSKIAHHQPDPKLANQEQQESYINIFQYAFAFIPRWKLVVYEALVQNPQDTMDNLFAWMGRPSRLVEEEIYDGNEKWR